MRKLGQNQEVASALFFLYYRLGGRGRRQYRHSCRISSQYLRIYGSAGFGAIKTRLVECCRIGNTYNESYSSIGILLLQFPTTRLNIADPNPFSRDLITKNRVEMVTWGFSVCTSTLAISICIVLYNTYMERIELWSDCSRTDFGSDVIDGK